MSNLPSLDELKKGKIKTISKKDDNGNGKVKYNSQQAKKGTKQKTVEEKAKEDLENKSFNELIDILLNENKDISISELIKIGSNINIANGDKKTPKSSPLEGIRKGLEDVFTIQQLKELITDGRVNTPKNEKESADYVGNTLGGMDLSSIVPILEALNGEGIDITKISPLILSQAMGSGKSGNNNLSSILAMLSMGKLLSGNNQSNGHSNLNAEMFSQVYKEIKELMTKNQQSAPIDNNTLLLAKLMNQNTNNPQVEKLLLKFEQMISNNQTQTLANILAQQQERTEILLEKIAGMMHRTDPTQEIAKYFGLFSRLQGDKRSKTKDEMDFAIKNKELELQERRYDRVQEREYQKEMLESERSGKIIDAVKELVFPIVGNGLGSIIDGVRGTKKSPLKRKGLNDVDIDKNDLELL